MWRIPPLISAIVLELQKSHTPELEQRGEVRISRRAKVEKNIRKHFFALLVDMLQILQVVFIVGTVVQLPCFAVRLYKFAHMSGVRSRQIAVDGLSRLRSKLGIWREVGTPVEEWNRLELMAPHLLSDVVLPSLEARELCLVAQTSTALRLMSEENSYWEVAYQKDFGTLPTHHAALRSVKISYADAYRNRVCRTAVKSVTQQDWEQGVTFLIHDEFMRAVQNIHHFPLLPLKAAGLIAFCAHALMQLRYSNPSVQLAAAGDAYIASVLRESSLLFWGNGLRGMPNSNTADHYLGIRWPVNFWQLDVFLLRTLYAAAESVINELAICIGLLNTLVFAVGTLGWPIWLRVVGGNDAITTVFTGIFFPAFVAFQIFLLVLPMTALHWWVPTSFISTVIWDSFISLAEPLLATSVVQATTAGEVLRTSTTAAAGLVSVIYSLTLGPYIQYTAPSLEQAVLHGAQLTGQGLYQLPTLLRGIFSHDMLPFLSVRGMFPLLSVDLGQLHVILQALVWPLESALGMEVALLRWAHDATFGFSINWVFSSLLYIGASHWVLFGLWLVVMWKGQCLTWALLLRMFPGFDPLNFYQWPFVFTYRVIAWISRTVEICSKFVLRHAHLAFDAYGKLLGFVTRCCAGFGLLGDIFLTPIALLWMFWPLRVPLFMGQVSLFTSAIPISLVLCRWGVPIIKRNWQTKMKKC